jgi:type II secretory pathway component PulF
MAQSGRVSRISTSAWCAPGEAGGALEQVLSRLAEYLEGQVRLRNR